MKKLLLILAIVVISITAFGQLGIEFKSLDYHKYGILITENEYPMFIQNLKNVASEYEELIIASRSFSVAEPEQSIDVGINKICGYFLGDGKHMYQIFLIPYYNFQVIKVNDTLRYQLIVNFKPTEPGYIPLKGFTHTFKDLNSFNAFIDILETYYGNNWDFVEFLGDKYDMVGIKLNKQNFLTPYYGYTILRDSPKGKKLTKVKISILKKTKPVILLNEGIRYAFDEYLKVYYNGKIGWVSIRSFNPQDVYAIRKYIVWMDNENVNF